MFTRRYLHHYRKLTLAVLALAAVAFPPAVRAQYGLALSPMRTELNVAPGTQRNGSLSIANDDATPDRFRTEILDLSIDKEAVPQFEKDIPSEKEFSCKDWLTVNPMEGEIPGKGQLMVRYTVKVPPDSPTRTYHCALGFTTLPDPKKQQQPMGIVALLRLGHILCHRRQSVPRR